MAAIYKREKVISKSRAEALIQNELDQMDRQEEEYYSSGGSSGKLNSHTIAQAAHDAELGDWRKNRRLERVSSVIERQKEIDRYRANPSPGATSGRNNKYTTAVSEQRKEITGLLDDIRSNYKAYKAYYGSSALSELESNLSSLLDGLDKKKSASNEEENQARGAFPQQFQPEKQMPDVYQKVEGEAQEQAMRIQRLLQDNPGLDTLYQMVQDKGRRSEKYKERYGITEDDLRKAYQTVYGEQVRTGDSDTLQKQAESARENAGNTWKEYERIRALTSLPYWDYSGDQIALSREFREQSLPELETYAKKYGVLLNAENPELFSGQLETLQKRVYEAYTRDHEADETFSSASTDAGAYQKEQERLRKLQEELQPYEDLRRNADFAEKSSVNENYASKETQSGSHMYNSGDDFQYDLVNDLGEARQMVELGLAGIREENAPIAEMTPEEVQIYNYLYQPEDQTAAKEYLQKLMPLLNKRYSENLAEGTAEFASKNTGTAILSNAYSVLNSVNKGKAMGYVLRQTLSGEDADSYSPYFDATVMNQAIRGTTGEGIQNSVGGFGGEALSFLYDTGMSFVDSVGSAAAFGPGGLAVIGLSAASDTSYDVLQRGGDTDQALVAGGLAGVAEAAFEKIGLDNLFGAATPGARRSLLLTGLKQAGIEGSEEALTEVANFISDTAVLGELSNYQLEVRQGIAQGLTRQQAEEQAMKTFAQNVGLAALGGGLMGGVGGTVSGGIGNLRSQNEPFTNPGNENMIETEGRAAAGPKERTVGDVTYRYTETAPEAYTPRSQEIKSGFDELGIASTITDGAAESERNGRVVTQRGQASTLKDGSILVRNDADSTLSTGQIVGHEMYHVGKERHAAESQAFYDSIAESGNINFQSEAFRDIYNRINRSYFNGKLDFAEDYAKFYEELVGYISGDLKANDGSLSEDFASMFYDSNAITESWSALHDVFLQDGKERVNNGQSRERGYAETDETTGRGLFRSETPGSNTGRGSEAGEVLSGIRQVYGAEAEGEAQSYGEIGNFAVQDGQPGGVSAQRGSNPYGTETGAEGRTGAVSGAIRATDPKSGRTVTVTGIADPDRATVQLSDGRTAAAGSIQYRDETSGALVKEAILMPSAASANVFLSGYHGGDVSLYAGEFKRYLSAGQAGNSFSYTSGRYGIGIIDSDVAKSAWYIGKNLAEAETRAQQKAANREKKTARTQEQTAYFTRDYDSALSREQEAQLSVLSSMAENRKQNIRVVDTIDGGKTNAYYNRTTGEIVVALDAKDGAYLYWAGHELTHKMRRWSPDRYAELRDFVLSELEKTDSEFDLERRIREIQRMYEARGETLSRADAVEEIVANSVGTVFSDETAVRTFAQEHKTTMQKLAQWFDEFIQTLKEAVRRVSGRLPEAAKIQKNLDLLEQIRDTAYRALEEMEGVNTGGEPGGKKYSIAYTTENRPVVVVEENILDGVPKSEWVKTVKEAIGKFSGGIPVGGRLIKVNAITRDEYTGSKYTRRQKRNRNVLYKDKFLASGQINEIVLGSTNYVNEDLNHERKDNFKEFARGDVLLRIGNRDYSAKVIVGFTGGKQMVLYDVIDFVPAEINLKNGIKNEDMRAVQSQKVKNNGKGISSVNSVSQSSDAVNTSISKNAKNDTQNDTHEKKFSLNDTTPADMERLRVENEQKDAVISALREEFKLTKGHKLKPAAIDKISGKILREYHSEYSRATLTENLSKIYDYLANGENVAWDYVLETTTALANSVIEKSSVLNRDLYNEYAELRRFFRETKIAVPESVRADVSGAYGSWNDFRKQNLGKLRFAKDGIALDSLWGELSEQYPEFFPKDTGEAEQFAAVVEALDAVQPYYENPFGMNQEEAAYDLALSMYESYFDVPEVRTFADKQAQKLTEAKIKFGKQKEAVRDSIKDRYEKKLSRLREQQNGKMDRMRERLLEQRAKLKEEKSAALKRQRERTAESANRAKYRHRIDRNLKDLSQRLFHPTDKKHLPEEFRKGIASALSFVDTSGKDQSPNRDQTQNTIRFYELRKACQSVLDSEESSLIVDPDLPAMIDDLQETAEGKRIADMTAAELRQVSDVLDRIAHSVRDADKLFTGQQNERLSELSESLFGQLEKGKRKKEHGQAVGMVDKLLSYDMMDTASYFDSIGGEAAQRMYRMLRDGLDRKITHTRETEVFMRDLLGRSDLKTKKQRRAYREKMASWTGKHAELRTFVTEGGETLKMTPAQIMTLYALNQREQARGHLYGGGIRPTLFTAAGSDHKRQKIIVRQDAPVRVTPADVASITGTLTQEQKQIADGMMRFLSTTVAEWGNETSMQMYGYRKFTEQHYVPIVSDPNYTASEIQKDNNPLFAVRNLGFTKSTQRNANNPIMVDDLFDVFSKHADQMATYHAFAAPLSDLTRVYNYKRTNETADGYRASTPLKQEMERTMGKAGREYFHTLLKDINGTANVEVGGEIAQRNLSKAKAAAVGANLRVAIQQPTSIVRAMAMLDPKYFVPTSKVEKGVQERMLQYAPIAQWKDYGFYELDVGRSVKDIFMGQTTWTERSMALAEKGDTITWCAIWRAIERETADRTDLKAGTEAFYRAVGARFSDVIDRTQVVDSVLHRSQIMRQKGIFLKMATSFMAEPTKTYNLFRNSLVEMRKNPNKANKRQFIRTTVSLVMTSLTTSAAAALISALRDDDDDKTYWEKYLRTLFGYDSENTALQNALGFLASEFGGNINPLNLVPYFKDLMSIVDGYDVERMDMTQASKVLKSGLALMQSITDPDYKRTPGIVFTEFLLNVAGMTGVSMSNLYRDTRAIENTITAELSHAGVYLTPYEYHMFRLTNKIGSSKNRTQYYSFMLAARLRGDDALVKQIYNDMIGAGFQPKDISDGVSNLEKAVLMKTDERILKAAEARINRDTDAYLSYVQEIKADGYKSDAVIKAINSTINKINKASADPLTAEELEEQRKEYEEALFSDGETEVYAYSDVKAFISSGDPDGAQELLDYLVEEGKTAKGIKSALSREYKKQYLDALDAGEKQKADALEKTLKKLYADDENGNRVSLYTDEDFERWKKANKESRVK